MKSTLGFKKAKLIKYESSVGTQHNLQVRLVFTYCLKVKRPIHRHEIGRQAAKIANFGKNKKIIAVALYY